jgi:hypothetical protein
VLGPGGAQAKGAAQAPPKPAAPPRKRGLTPALIAMLAVVGVVILGSGSLVCVWYRFGYSHGAVFEHLPPDCDEMRYIDFASIGDSAAVKPLASKREKSLVGWAEDQDDDEGIRRSLDEDAKGRAATLRTLDKLGLRPYADVKEVAFCAIHEDGGKTETMFAIGGSFRGKDLLSVVREGLLHRDRRHKEDKLKIDDIDGRPYLKLDEDQFATMAGSQVLLLGPKKLIEKYVPVKPVAREYAMHDGEVLVHREVGDGDKPKTLDERIALTTAKLTYTRVTSATSASSGEADVKAIKDRLQTLSPKLEKVDGLEALVDGYDNADVIVESDEVRLVVSWPMKDVSEVTKAFIESDWHDLKPMIELVKQAPGIDFYRAVVAPSADVFDLRLSPW